MVKVIIVGGGISGLTASYSLSSLGFDVVIYEKDDSSNHQYTGSHVNIFPNGSFALSQLGLIDYLYLRGVGTPFSNIGIYDKNDNILFRNPLLHSPHFQGRSFMRADLYTCLLYCLKAQGLSSLRYKEVTSVKCLPENVEVHFSDGTVDTADFVVAADGLYSPIRESQFPTKTSRVCSTGRIAIVSWCKVDIQARSLEKIRNYLRKKDLATLISPEVEVTFSYTGSGRVSFSVSVPVDHLQNYFKLQGSDKSLLKTIKGHQLKEYVLEITKSFQNPTLHYILENGFWKDEEEFTDGVSCQPKIWEQDGIQLPDSFVNDRIVLIGDAAHGLHPKFGQRCSQLFEDVMILKREFIRQGLIETVDDIRNVLKKYNQERYPQVTKIRSLSCKREYPRSPSEYQRQRLFFYSMFSPQSILNSEHNVVNKYLIERGLLDPAPMVWLSPILKASVLSMAVGCFFWGTLQRRDLTLWR